MAKLTKEELYGLKDVIWDARKTTAKDKCSQCWHNKAGWNRAGWNRAGVAPDGTRTLEWTAGEGREPVCSLETCTNDNS